MRDDGIATAQDELFPVSRWAKEEYIKKSFYETIGINQYDIIQTLWDGISSGGAETFFYDTIRSLLL